MAYKFLKITGGIFCQGAYKIHRFAPAPPLLPYTL